MQFSEHWLRSLVDPPLDNDELAHLLTMAGLEVEEKHPVAQPFGNVVVAHVLSVDKHPDADKLKLCRVDVGDRNAGPLQIVCGAPNVAAGMKVPCALIGAELPGIRIRKAKVRGIESFGMLCSARELGLPENTDGGGLLALDADAPPGQDIRQHLLLDDTIFTLKLTPNRADCLSLQGVAREVAALSGTALTLPQIAAVPAAHDKKRNVVLDAPTACPRYCGRIVSEVDGAAPTPAWMSQRLERSGIRSLGALIDITNYVMLELGQPMHAFDNATLTGSIHVRFPHAGEQIKLLNGQTIAPTSDTALIADEHDSNDNARALALAGIMGGENSGVGPATREVFLESAFFTPDAVAGKARSLGFSSDASYRFERGVDFALQRIAIERATQLILDICGGRPGPVVEAVAAEYLPLRHPVRLRSARVTKILGIRLDNAQIEKLLQGLGFAWRNEDGGNTFIVTPPTYRYDIEIEEDLIEELARLHGYDNIPAPLPTGRIAMLSLPEERRMPMQARHLMAERGYREVVNFSFVDADWERDFCANAAPIALSNPIASQMGVMRSSLIGGLVSTLAFNLKRRSQRVRIFEIGRCFLRSDAPPTSSNPVAGFHQPQRLGALCAGSALAEQWGEKTRNADFYDLKGDIEALFPAHALRFEKIAHPALHPGRAASILLEGKIIGCIGELHPEWVQTYELGSAPVVCEIDFAALSQQPLPCYREVSRFPAVLRDLSLLLPLEQPLQPLLDAMRNAAPPIVRSIELFDIYQGKGIEENQKSLAFHIVMQDTEGTLADFEADAAIDRLIGIATEKFSATLRS